MGAQKLEQYDIIHLIANAYIHRTEFPTPKKLCITKLRISISKFNHQIYTKNMMIAIDLFMNKYKPLGQPLGFKNMQSNNI